MEDDVPTRVCRNPLIALRIFVVNRAYPDLYRAIVERFADRGDVVVVLDRLEGERQMTTALLEGRF